MSVINQNVLGGGLDIIVVDEDPSSVSVDAMEGSLIIYKPTEGAAEWFIKTSDGDNTDTRSVWEVGD